MGIYVDPQRREGRPAPDGREAREMRCYDFLDAAGIPYKRADHDRADTVNSCQAVEAVLGAPICRNLFLTNRQKTEYYLLLLPGDKPFKTRFLSGQLGTARLSFADGEAMERLMDLLPGSVSLLGLMNDREGKVRLVIDGDLKREEYFCCHPCMNTSTLRLRTADVLEKLIPRLGHTPAWVNLPWDPDAE